MSEIRCGLYAIDNYPNLIIYAFLHSAKPSWWMVKVARWDDNDAITYDTLRMRITNLT